MALPMSFGIGQECVGKRSPDGEGGGIEDQRVSARGGHHSSPGCPKGESTSHGTRASYDRNRGFGQREAVEAAELPPQGVWAEFSAAAVEPALLPGARVSRGGETLAGGQTAAAASGHAGGTAAACRGGARAAKAGF